MINNYIQTYSVQRGQRELKKLLPLIEHRGYICGSYAAWCGAPDIHLVRPNDIDIFAKTQSFAEDMALEICNKFHCSYVKLNELVLSIDFRAGKPIQIIKPNPRWNDFPDDILNDFDLDISRAYVLDLEHVRGDVHLGYPYAKLLRVNNPMKSLQRILKYHKRGVEFDEHELVKLFRAWQDLEPDRRDSIVFAIESKWRDAQAVEAAAIYDFYDDDDYFDGE